MHPENFETRHRVSNMEIRPGEYQNQSRWCASEENGLTDITSNKINRNDKECDMNSASIHPGFRLILPYLRQIENLILDPEISEIMINSPSDIFIEKQGVMERVLG